MSDRAFSTEQAARYMAAVFRGPYMIRSSLGLFSDAKEVGASIVFRGTTPFVVVAAAMAGCTRLYPEDLQDGALIAGVRIVNPFL